MEGLSWLRKFGVNPDSLDPETQECARKLGPIGTLRLPAIVNGQRLKKAALIERLATTGFRTSDQAQQNCPPSRPSETLFGLPTSSRPKH